MSNDKKLSKADIARGLKEALEPFCEEMKELRPSLAHPFRQEDCVLASDGHILIRIRTKEAGVAIGPFRRMDEFDAQRPIQDLSADGFTTQRFVARADLEHFGRKAEDYADANPETTTFCELGGQLLQPWSAGRIARAMAVCGADVARLVWAKNHRVVLQLENREGCECVTILHMGCVPGDERRDVPHLVSIPTADSCDPGATCIDWQRGLATWAEIKADLARQEEAERMARREVWLVEVVKRAYVPVYARSEKEARRILDRNWIDPEDDGDDEWMLGDTVPELEDLDDLDDCYETIVTADGSKTRDEIYQMDRLSQEWEEKQKGKEGAV